MLRAASLEAAAATGIATRRTSVGRFASDGRVTADDAPGARGSSSSEDDDPLELVFERLVPEERSPEPPEQERPRSERELARFWPGGAIYHVVDGGLQVLRSALRRGLVE